MYIQLAIRVVLAMLIIGCTGFMGGYFGGPLIGRDGTAGPLNGIFISGPIGVVVGAAVGGFSVDRKWEASRYCATVAVSALAMAALGTLLWLA